MPTPRFDAIDALRGFALLWMVLFHFGFDLNYFGYWKQDFYHDPFWTGQRTAILSLFLFCAGLGQAVALQQGQSWSRFWRRWAQIALCAMLVSFGSWLMFPGSFIHFGVLHGIAVMLILVRISAPWARWFWLLGGLAIGAKYAAAALLAGSPLEAVMNGGGLNWLGFVTRKPITEDYVPVFPWIGVMWWGVASGNWLLARRLRWLSSVRVGGVRLLAGMGRWSLSVYMLHQPLLIGALALLGLAR